MKQKAKHILTSAVLAGLLIAFPFSYSLAQEIDFHVLEKTFNKLVGSCQKYVVSVVAQRNPSSSVNRRGKSSVKMVASGFIVDTRGVIVTRSSVLQGMDKVIVILYDGKRLDATLLGLEEQYSFALLATEPLPFKNPYFSQTNSERKGNWVLVIGNSLGFYPSVSVGLVNETLPNGIIQIVTKIWPGSVGAPVINLRGQVIGLLAGRVEPLTGDDGLDMIGEDEGVVIPMAHLLPRIKEIVDNASSGAPWVGITLTRYPRDNKQVVYRITHIAANSPAERAGLKLGDEIVACDGKPIRDLRELRNYINGLPVSESISFKVKRKGKMVEHVVQLERKPVLFAHQGESLQRPSQPEDSGLTRFPTSQVNQLLYRKRITQIEGHLQFLKESIKKNKIKK